MQVTQHLIDHGYRDIGIICGPREMLNTPGSYPGLAAGAGSLIVSGQSLMDFFDQLYPRWRLRGDKTHA